MIITMTGDDADVLLWNYFGGAKTWKSFHALPIVPKTFCFFQSSPFLFFLRLNNKHFAYYLSI